MSAESGLYARGAGATWQRLRALVRKETHQLARDPSSILAGVVLPLILILIFGYGISFDIKRIPIAVVLDDPSPTAFDVVSGIYLSPFFEPVRLSSMNEAEHLMLERKVDGIVHLPSDFSRQLASGAGKVQILANGVDANRSRALLGYAQGAIAQWGVQNSAASATRDRGVGALRIEQRMWFNEANDSSYFLVPGLIVLIMTLIGAYLTALGMAREWERGTIESLFVTPVRPGDVLISKIVPYFGIGLIGLILCLLAAKFVFVVPIRGSVAMLMLASMLYLLVALGVGLVVSATIRSQFLASQVALVATFMPALLLSGFMFDLHSMPAAVRAISYVLPATYFVELLQTMFLAGNVWPVILRDCAVLAFDAAVLLAVARVKTRKELR